MSGVHCGVEWVGGDLHFRLAVCVHGRGELGGCVFVSMGWSLVGIY